MDDGPDYDLMEKNFLQWLHRWTRAFINWPKVYEDVDYREAFSFKNNFEPKNQGKYEWVGHYAHFVFDQLLSANNTLDSKAESLIKVFSSGSGLLSLGAILQLSKVSALVVTFWGASLLLAVLCIISASLVRFPKDSYLPPSIAWALQYVKEFDDAAEPRFFAQWHVACEGLRLSNARKTFGLKVSAWLGMSAICVLALSFGAAIATMKVGPPSAIHGPDMTDANNSSPPPAPNPTTQPQTPSPASSPSSAGPQASGPQSIQAGRNAAVSAGPQSIQESRNRD